jgi:hypothetical protein
MENLACQAHLLDANGIRVRWDCSSHRQRGEDEEIQVPGKHCRGWKV